jgi:glutathione peroxidase-family protein
MNPSEILSLLLITLKKYMCRGSFTGKIIFTIHCREGRAAKCTSDVQENFTKIFIENNGCVIDKK